MCVCVCVRACVRACVRGRLIKYYDYIFKFQRILVVDLVKRGVLMQPYE